MADHHATLSVGVSASQADIAQRLSTFLKSAGWDIPHKAGSVLEIEQTLEGACGKRVRDLAACPLSGACHAEARRYADELMHYAKELARSNEELEQFASVTSHELQDPLHSINNYAYLLRLRYRKQLDPNEKRYFESIIGTTDRMRNLIHDLLRYSKVSRDVPVLESVELENILSQALSELDPMIQRAGAEIERDTLPAVRAHPLQMQELFHNLIQNAVKFRGQTRLIIRIWAERIGDEWVIAVKDNGIGIPPEHHERIFSIFHRAHAKSDYSGSGIGLAICKKIVERHDGRIWVESEPDRGSTFRFTIPA